MLVERSGVVGVHDGVRLVATDDVAAPFDAEEAANIATAPRIGDCAVRAAILAFAIDVDVAAESEDDVEASDEDYDDDQIDDEDLVEAEAEDTNLIPIKVDGKEEMWTLDQLKQSAAGQAAINKRFQEAAEARKQIEQANAALAQQQQQLVQLYQQAQQGGLQAPTPPSRELFESDPIGYMEEKLKYDEAKAGYDQQLFQIQQAHQQTVQQQAQAHQEYRTL